MKVLELVAHNVMGIKDVRFDLEGHNLFLIGGKNGQGKTSAIKALLMALCGRSGMSDYPEVALREGEDSGFVTVKLSGSPELHDDKGFTVRLHMKRKVGGGVSEEFEVLDSTGDPAASPRDLLKSLYSLKAFDPMAFERMSPKEQLALVVKLVGLDLSELDSEYKEKYAERTQVNNAGKKLKAVVDAMKSHDDAPKEMVSMGDLADKMNAAVQHNSTLDKMRRNIESGMKNLRSTEEQIEEINQKIEQLAKKAADLAALSASMEARIKAEEEELSNMPPEIDVTEIKSQMSVLESQNQKFLENKNRSEKLADLEDMRSQSEALTNRLKQILEDKASKIKNANWPVAGLSLTDDCVLYEDLPFQQANKAKRVEISTKIGMALNPSLRLLVCEDGSSLDTDTLSVLDEMLKEGDFQMIMEVVTRTQEDNDLCSVVIRNGHVDATAS